MSKRNTGQEILEGIQEIKAFKAGEGDLRTHTFHSGMEWVRFVQSDENLKFIESFST